MSTTSSSSSIDHHHINNNNTPINNNIDNIDNIDNNMNDKYKITNIDFIKEYNLPKLLNINDINFRNVHLGPTDTSNWILPNRILMSSYPGDLNLEKSKLKIEQLLKNGINCFVCLQLKEELNRFIPYKPIIEEYCNLNNININNITFLQLEIPDNYITKDEHVVKFINLELLPQIKENKTILIHCWGGHGRTGTISSILLSHLYKLNSLQSLEYISKVHSCRIIKKSRAPQTESQFKQVHRLSFINSKLNEYDNEYY